MPDFQRKESITQPSPEASLNVISADLAAADNERRAYRAAANDLLRDYNAACDEIARLNELLNPPAEATTE